MKVSYHNHTVYSDGKDTPEAMAKAAYATGLSHFAFTDHVYSEDYAKGTVAPQDYPIYTEHINRLKEKYRNDMRIFTGIEADWYKEHGTFMSRYEDIEPLIEFTVGSIHNLMPKDKIYLIDGSLDCYIACLQDGYNGDIQRMVTDYFEGYLEMAHELKPNLLGHIDIIRKNNLENRFFTGEEPWLIRMEELLAKEIAKLGLVTEVNGGGDYRYQNGIYYPSDHFLEILRENNVRLTIGLDAHSVDMVPNYYEKSIDIAKRAGYQTLWRLNETNDWEEHLIDTFYEK